MFSRETGTVVPGMETLVDTHMSKRILSFLRHHFLDVLMTSHRGRVQQSRIFVRKGLGSLRHVVNVLPIANLSGKAFVIRVGLITAYAVPLSLYASEALSFDGTGHSIWKETFGELSAHRRRIGSSRKKKLWSFDAERGGKTQVGSCSCMVW